VPDASGFFMRLNLESWPISFPDQNTDPLFYEGLKQKKPPQN
jgi:hypothetical protein